MVDLTKQNTHEPVLFIEALSALGIQPGGIYVDATVGSGGHAAGILERSAPDGRLLGLDADPDALEVAAARLRPFGERVVLVQSNFAHIGRVARKHGFDGCDGILYDLGLSSRQLSVAGRGFSWQVEAPLDMRLDPRQPGPTAADVINGWSEQDIADLIYRLGQEPAARRIARAVVKARPLHTTGALAAVIEACIGKRGRIHPATKTFLALRRYINTEDETLSASLSQAVDLLRPGGRLAVIAFHGGEDVIVKTFFRRESCDCICGPEVGPVCTCGHKASLKLITRHVIKPTDEEQRRNPRSRSGRLRVAERL